MHVEKGRPARYSGGLPSGSIAIPGHNESIKRVFENEQRSPLDEILDGAHETSAEPEIQSISKTETIDTNPATVHNLTTDTPTPENAKSRTANRGSLAPQFARAQALMVMLVSVMSAIVALWFGLAEIRKHLALAGINVTGATADHVRSALIFTALVVLGTGLVMAVVLAFVAHRLLRKRIQIPLNALERAAVDVANGRFNHQVPDYHYSAEFDSLIRSFNQMADRLAYSEARRRRLMTDIAHELRTPLSILTVNLEGLQDNLVPWNAGTRRVLSGQVSRLSRLARDINAVSAADEHKFDMAPTRQSIANIVTDAVAAHREKYGAKGVHLIQAGSYDLEVQVDRERILQLLGNLLENALRHTQRGGRVTVSWVAAGGYARISVTDTGEGIDPAHVPHVFDRFYRAPSEVNVASGGSGIGLTICRALAEAHGGSISVASEGLGYGAQIVFSVPLVRPRRGGPDRSRPREQRETLPERAA